jgi:hypothetical protein
MVNSKTLHNLGALLGRATLAARMGYQYGTDRDLYQALGYPTTNIQYSEFASRYERQDIAKAIINRPVSYTWKGPITLKIIGQEESEIGKAWKELDKRLQLRSKFVRLDKLSCIGRYGVLLLGFDDVSDREGFRKPVNKNNKKLLYVKPLGEGHAKIQRFVKNPRDPRYGLPEEYEIEYTENDSETVVTLFAHWTRVLHVTNELLESEVYGVPVLQAVYNRLMDLEKLVGGSAEMFWRGARPGYQGKVKEDYTLPTDVENGLQDQLDEFEHNLRRVFVNEGVDLEALATQVSDPANHVDVQIQMIAAVTGIPKRILTGSERGELSSAQDIIAWFSYIQTRREEHAEINILRPFVQKCMQHGVLPVSEDYVVQWSDLFASSEKDKAEVGRTRAMAVREYTTNPMAESLIPPKAFFRLFLGLSEDEQAEIEKMSSDEVMEELRRIVAGGDTEEVAEEPVNANNE